MRRFLAGGLLLLALAGCKSTVATTITPTETGDASVVVEAVFEGEVAAAIVATQESADSLRENITRLSGQNPEITGDKEKVTARINIGVEDTVALSRLTGVKNITVSPTGEQVSAALAQPLALIEALEETFKDRPDYEAVMAAVEQLVRVSVTVVMEGGITEATSQEAVVIEGNGATISRGLEEGPDITFTVTGNPAAEGPGILTYALFAAGALLILGAAASFVFKRKPKT